MLGVRVLVVVVSGSGHLVHAFPTILEGRRGTLEPVMVETVVLDNDVRLVLDLRRAQASLGPMQVPPGPCG